MVEIIRVCKESVPAMRFIGKKYGDEDSALLQEGENIVDICFFVE